MLKDKIIAVGVCGGIAAYKACDVVSKLKKSGCAVKVIMTKNSREFVSELTLKTLSQNNVLSDMFEYFNWDVQHISVAKEADLFVIIPATANILGKVNSGIADDLLSTMILATKSGVMFFPSMNTNMYENITVQENINSLKRKGYIIIQPQSGSLACGDIGKGRLPDTDYILNCIKQHFIKKDFLKKTVLVTAGATIEDIDGIRFISNHSSGKMGCEIARAANDRGANVILIAGMITALPPKDVEVIYTKTTEDMRDEVMKNLSRADIIIKAAAPSDYRVSNKAENKIKTDNLTLKLQKTPDIAKEVGEVKGDKKLVIFCAETENLKSYAKAKMIHKNADLIVANDVNIEGAGFNSDTNIVSILSADGGSEDLPIMPKYDVANKILDKILSL
ncbi:MAG: bifunctional phosphopantothenoylcysteine decarboxylase/phosphopantothenate--cysteine ligase CoaBC [Clostridia bacterium]|nr:bifunctional phosphopantothenoylcysteine decarboxylase/phosphopantothenate--cysteine ligase CoaBC [Clostridia bacterium]